MKSITVNFDDKVIASFETITLLRTMNGHNDILVSAMAKILQAIRDDKDEVELKFKRTID